MTAARIQCRGLACGYHGKVALQDVDFELAPASVTALLGPNGSGKSALLKTMCRLLPQIAGEVWVDGDSIASWSFAQIATRVAYVPQEEPTPFPFLVRDFVTMGRLPRSTGLFDTVEDRAVAQDAMEMAECTDLAGRPITELSGGEKQRALIARALAQQADVLLLDEPTSHLDVAHQLTILSLLRRLADSGRTILVAIHDLNLAAGMAEDGIVLHAGRVSLKATMRKTLESSALDTAYGVQFERTGDGSGPPRLFPIRPSP